MSSRFSDILLLTYFARDNIYHATAFAVVVPYYIIFLSRAGGYYLVSLFYVFTLVAG